MTLAREALADAVATYGDLLDINALAVDGRDEEVRSRLETLTRQAEARLPVARAVLGIIDRAVNQIAADLQAAKRHERTQATLAPFFSRDAEPRPDAANDETSDHPPSPEQPSPSVA